MKLLKQTTTGDIFVWTENLAARDDMVEFTRGEAPAPTEPVETPADEGNPSENSGTETAEPAVEEGLADAAEAFRKAVSKPGRKTKAQG
jgi:hypothetical protein